MCEHSRGARAARGGRFTLRPASRSTLVSVSAVCRRPIIKSFPSASGKTSKNSERNSLTTRPARLQGTPLAPRPVRAGCRARPAHRSSAALRGALRRAGAARRQRVGGRVVLVQHIPLGEGGDHSIGRSDVPRAVQRHHKLGRRAVVPRVLTHLLGDDEAGEQKVVAVLEKARTYCIAASPPVEVKSFVSSPPNRRSARCVTPSSLTHS